MSERVNKEIFNSFEILNDSADSEEQDNELTITQEIKRDAEREFKMRWGWVDMAMSIRESTGDKFDEIMQKNVAEVLTLATYLIEKIEILKVRHGNTSGG